MRRQRSGLRVYRQGPGCTSEARHKRAWGLIIGATGAPYILYTGSKLGNGLRDAFTNEGCTHFLRHDLDISVAISIHLHGIGCLGCRIYQLAPLSRILAPVHVSCGRA